MTKLKTATIALGFVACAYAVPSNSTPHETAAATITQISSGWTDPNLKIQLDMPYYNPDACAANDGYLVPPTLPANQQITAIAITAYSMKQRVVLTIDGCYLDRPRVIAITLGGV